MITCKFASGGEKKAIAEADNERFSGNKSAVT
jgi:hypothetical protein